MRHGICIPTLREHRNRDNAADRPAKLARLSDRVHDLAEQFLFGDVVTSTGIPRAFHDLTAKPLNLVSSHAPKLTVECVTCFELLTVDEQRVRTGKGIAGALIKVAEQCQTPVFERGRAILVFPMITRDKVIDQLRDGRILADDDEAGWDLDAVLFPEPEGLFIVTVEDFQCGLQTGGKFEWVEFLRFSPSLFWHVLADVFPEVTEHGHVVAGDILRDRHAWEFDYARTR